MLVDDFAAMSWYYSHNGTQLGPISEEELVKKGRNGEVLPIDLVWKEGMGDWVPMGQVPELKAGAGLTVTAGGGASGQQAPAGYVDAAHGRQVPNYLWQAIVSTLLCCMPFTVVAIVYAAKVDSLVASGDMVGANSASKSAKTWVTVAVGSWLVVVLPFILFYVVLMIIGAAASVAQ